MSLSSWDRLGQDRAYTANRARSSLARSLQSAANAIHELITASPPPGSQKQLIFPHDHGRRGGIPLARGSHWSFAAQAQDNWRIEAVLSTLDYWLQGAGTTATTDKTKSPANIVLDVPFGLDTSKTAMSGASAGLEAKVRIYLPTGSSNSLVAVKFQNITTGTNSSTININTFGAVNELSFDDIPIKEDQRNELILSVRPDVGAIDVDVLSINICSTRDRTQPITSGSSALITAISKP
tara:strand:- start:179 stop:892 length:714 start_codon:yes stop_codon:yes gene_type:complete